MARTASNSLPIYDWDSKDTYHSFSIFWHALENWLLLNHITPDSKDHLQYVFAALGTKSLEMHAQWMPAGSEEEQRVTKAKASAFLNRIHQGMTHDVNTHVHLRELEDVVARLGENPQDLITCIKTLIDWCEMINDQHHEHELCCHIVHAYCHEGKLLGKPMAKPFKTPSSELADITVNHFAIQYAWNKSPTAPNLWTQSAMTSIEQPAPATMVMVTHHLHPTRTVPTAHDSTQPAEQTALHGIPIAPNATRWDTGDWNAAVTSHFNWGIHLHQEMYPQLGHSRWSPDAHLGTTTATLGGVAKQTLQMSARTTALKMRLLSMASNPMWQL